jgi:hypothetical protein
MGDAYPVGARLDLRVGDKLQRRTVGANTHIGAAHDAVLHFGLGRAEEVDELVLRLTDGRVYRRRVEAVNQRIRFFQGAHLPQ